MRLSQFRIKNFRSIVDTGWTNFSIDGVTVLVGQNESGKTSILEALSKALTLDEELSVDDLRINADLPQVLIRAELTSNELDDHFEDCDQLSVRAFNEALAAQSNQVEVLFEWEEPSKEKFTCQIYLADDLYANSVQVHSDAFKIDQFIANGGVTVGAISQPTTAPVTIKELDEELICNAIYETLPAATIFQTQTGLLPQSIDINEKYQLVGNGATAARNFLTVAGLSVEELVTSNLRTRNNIISRANESISKDLASFWSQTIGKSEKIQLQCEVHCYGADVPAKVGKTYLVFWMSDGHNKLYPHQRSLGTRWFVSFYLQIKASEKTRSQRIFLLDEPGANLHSKAQGDVLKLINQLSKAITIVYSTHSPHLIEYGKLYRVHAVQRDGTAEDSPTVTVQAHHLGTASSDTLSPVLTAMGVDLSSQQVIKKNNNVLLEEMSGFYYLTAFWQLTKEKQEAHFIAATGVNKVEALANMFRGWGIDFILAIDNDQQGRGVYNNMKREMYGNSDELAQKNMFKFPDCPGIEDAFSKGDFREYVLKDDTADIETSNSELMKNGARSKPVTAYSFMLDVKSGVVSAKNLDAESTKRIKTIVSGIVDRLRDRN